MTITVTGYRVVLSIPNLKKMTEQSIRRSYFDLGTVLVKESKRLILQPPKTGRLYRIPGRLSRRHRASAPGESPANLSGDLRRSVGYQVRGDQLIFGAGSGVVNYARFLEEGTRKMAARPYLIRSIRSNQRRMVPIFRRNFLNQLAMAA